MQGLLHLSEAVDEAGHAGVRGADHGQLVLDAAEDRVRGMLAGSGARAEPSVVGHDRERLGTAERELPRQIPDHVLEADERADFDRLRGHLKDHGLGPRIKIVGDQVSNHPRE